MSYKIEITTSCKKNMYKYCKKNLVLQKAIENKIEEIIQNPEHYKSLRHDLVGKNRVHILKSYVLMFEIKDDIVDFVYFGHHDEAYKR